MAGVGAGEGVKVTGALDKATLHALMSRLPLPAKPAVGRQQQPSGSEGNWGQPLQTVRVLECECVGEEAAQAAEEGSIASAESPAERRARPRLRHRLFARTRPGELRIATVVVTES